MLNHTEIFKVRKALGLTQRELGAILGLSAVSIHLVEKGELRLSESYQEILRNELGIDRKKADLLIAQYDEQQSLAGDKARALYKLKNNSRTIM